MNSPTWRWPNNKQIAVCFNVCLEAWSDGKAPGISPMGNPLPPGVLDNTAISWAEYGPRRGIYRLLDGFAKQGVKASVMTNAIIAERHPAAVKAAAAAGHEVVSHSYAMDVMPVMMKEDEERANIRRCTDLLQSVSGQAVKGWLSPRATPSASSSRLLTEAGFIWYGDTLADDLPYVETHGVGKIVAIPLSTEVNDMRSMKDGDWGKLPPKLAQRRQIEVGGGVHVANYRPISCETEGIARVFNVILFEPEIPPNTGNAIRLCANTGAEPGCEPTHV